MTIEKKTPHICERQGNSPAICDPFLWGPHAAIAIEIAKNMALNAHASPLQIAEDAVATAELLFEKMDGKGWLHPINDPFNIA